MKVLRFRCKGYHSKKKLLRFLSQKRFICRGEQSKSSSSNPGRADQALRQQGGFTLIEVVVTMVLLGMIGGSVVLAVSKIAEGYVFARLNSQSVQQAQVAIARISKELSEAVSPDADGNSVSFTRGGVEKEIYLSGKQLVLQIGEYPPAPLLGRVEGFSITNEEGGYINFSITIRGGAGSNLTFDNNTIFPSEFR